MAAFMAHMEIDIGIMALIHVPFEVAQGNKGDTWCHRNQSVPISTMGFARIASRQYRDKFIA